MSCLDYCPKKYLGLIYIYRRSHRIYWSLCSYWRKSSFKYSKKSSLETPYKRQIYLQYWKWARMDYWPFERYGNTGCRVSSSGIQNYVDFCLKVNRFKGFFNLFYKLYEQEMFWCINCTRRLMFRNAFNTYKLKIF